MGIEKFLNLKTGDVVKSLFPSTYGKDLIVKGFWIKYPKKVFTSKTLELIVHVIKNKKSMDFGIITNDDTIGNVDINYSRYWLIT